MTNEGIVGADVDLNWTFDSEGDLALVRGSDNLSQAIYLRLTALITKDGRGLEHYPLAWAYPVYGSYTKEWLGNNQNEYTRNTLLSEIKKRVLMDPRISGADVELVDWTANSIGIKITAHVVDGSSFQEFFIFGDMPRKDNRLNSPQWLNTWIDTSRTEYFAKQGEFITVQCYVRDENDMKVPIGEVSVSLGNYHIDIEKNPQEVAQSGSTDPGSCVFTFRIPPFIGIGTHKLKFKYKGIKGYNNCEGEANMNIVERLPTHMQYKYPNFLENWYYANDYDTFTDSIVHVWDANEYDVLSGQVRYYLSDYLEKDKLIFIEFPIIFHGNTLLQKTVYLYCSPRVLDYSAKFIFRVDYMFRPLNIFELVGPKGEHIDYLECLFDDDVFYLVSTLATIPYKDFINNERADSLRNDHVDIQRQSNCQITMEVIE